MYFDFITLVKYKGIRYYIVDSERSVAELARLPVDSVSPHVSRLPEYNNSILLCFKIYHTGRSGRLREVAPR
uniref:Uncharacterized protein n=1 Tax=Pararge aegeria TaxID=116150 RepID=S4PCL5_9NEOP